MTQSTSGFPPKLQAFIKQQYIDDYRKLHGVNPPTTKQFLTKQAEYLKRMTKKDFAALAVRLAESNVAHYKMFRRTPMELIQAEDRLEQAHKEYRDTPGKETPIVPSLRTLILDHLKDNRGAKFTIYAIAKVLKQKRGRTKVVLEYLVKDKLVTKHKRKSRRSPGGLFVGMLYFYI